MVRRQIATLSQVGSIPALISNVSEGSPIMRFSEAQIYLHSGAAIARSGWNGKGMYISYATGVEIPGVGTLAGFYYITQGNRLNTWVPSSADLIAEDWDLANG